MEKRAQDWAEEVRRVAAPIDDIEQDLSRYQDDSELDRDELVRQVFSLGYNLHAIVAQLDAINTHLRHEAIAPFADAKAYESVFVLIRNLRQRGTEILDSMALDKAE